MLPVRTHAVPQRRSSDLEAVERDRRVGDDLLAILARDPRMVLDPLRLKPLFGHTRCRRPALVLGFKVDALRLQGAMIYAGINIQLGNPLVDMVRPCLAPPLQQLGAVPVANLLPAPLTVHPHTESHTSKLQAQ